MSKRTLLELMVTESTLANVPSPRRILVDTSLIASVEDLGDNPRARCHVTLWESDDSVVESDAGEQVARGAKTLMTLDAYGEIRGQLSVLADIVPSPHASQNVIAEAIERARKRRQHD